MEPGVGMGIDSGENVFEVLVGIDVFGATGTDQGVEDGGGLAAAFAAEEHVVLFADAERSQNVLGGVVVRGEAQLFEVTAQGAFLVQRVSQGFAERRFRQQERRPGLGEEAVQNPRGAFFTQRQEIVFRLVQRFHRLDPGLDPIEQIDQGDEVFGVFNPDLRRLEEFSSDMAPAAQTGHAGAGGGFQKTGIGVALQEALKMFQGVLGDAFRSSRR